MEKMIRRMTGKMLVPASLSAALLFTGCGGTLGDKTTDEAKKYEVAMALDKADYDKAIALLQKDCAGYSYAECQINLGSAYMGKAGMDIISLGSKLIIIDKNTTASDTQKDTQIMTVLFDIITDRSVALGAAEYKKVLPDQNGSLCNSTYYASLSSYERQACIAINPILLQEITAKDTANQETLAVDISTIGQFKDVLSAVIPGITTSEIVSILGSGTLDAGKDINNNGDIDSMEATDCAIKAYNAVGNSNFTDYNCIGGEPTVSATDLGTIAFTHADYSSETIYGIDVNVSNGSIDSNFTRLVVETATAGVYTSVTTSGYCALDGTTACAEGSSGCYPCPVVDTNGNLETLSGTVTTVLNNDNLLTSIALMSDSNTSKTSDQKVTDFKNDVCYDNTNTFICDGTPSAPVITQSALLDYMAQ